MQKLPLPIFTSPTSTTVSSGWNLRLQHLNGSVTRLTLSTMPRLADQIHIHAGRVADEAEHGLIFALGNVDGQALTLEPVDELLALCGFPTPCLSTTIMMITSDVFIWCFFAKEKCGTGSTCAA